MKTEKRSRIYILMSKTEGKSFLDGLPSDCYDYRIFTKQFIALPGKFETTLDIYQNSIRIRISFPWTVTWPTLPVMSGMAGGRCPRSISMTTGTW